MAQLIVQKYGGATLADPQKILQVARRIHKLHSAGTQLVIIVSAMGQTTNQLIALAHQISERPPLRELDMLLTTGERISMSLLSMALNDLGCSAISFTGSQAGILTDDSHINASILEVKAFRVEEALRENKVVILAGFQGVSRNTKEITTLGRGGSDITAVAMAAYLRADRCEILKDVDCIYTADPKVISQARPIRFLNYDHLLEMTSWGAKVLHQNSVRLASEKKVTLYVGPASDTLSSGTLITSDKQFDTQTALAVNSYSHVLELQIETELQNFDLFQKFLQENRIPSLKLLSARESSFFFTGPPEALKVLQIFEPHQTKFKIANHHLASVSISYARSLNECDIARVLSHVVASAIPIFKSFCEGSSLHFFVNSEQKNNLALFLHELI